MSGVKKAMPRQRTNYSQVKVYLRNGRHRHCRMQFNRTWRRKFGQWFARMGKRYWSVVQVLANSRARPSSTRPQAKASAWLDSGTV